MVNYVLRKLALSILDKELREDWIHRSSFNDYTKWMSSDFPVMEDTYEYFLAKPYGLGTGSVDRHRIEMKNKYLKVRKGSKEEEPRPDFVPAPQLTVKRW